MVDFSNELVAFLFVFTLKTTLIGSLAWLAIRLVRDQNLKHRIACAALVGMLLLPIGSSLLPSLKVPVLSKNRAKLPNEGPIELHPTETQSRVQEPAITGNLTGVPVAEPAVSNIQTQPNATKQTTPTGSTEKARKLSSWHLPNWLTWPVCFTFAYFTFAAFFVFRIVIGLIAIVRLIANSEQVKLPADIQTSIAVRQSSGIEAPMMFGVLKPTILLPQNWNSWSQEKLHSVLAHETAHIDRRDWPIACLAEINSALFWFHPMAWLLRHFLAASAEVCCDDRVIGKTNSPDRRTAYARHLLEIAADVSKSRSKIDRAPLALTMASTTNVEKRIDSLLDFSRPLAKPISRTGIVGIVGTAFIVVSVCASLTASEKPDDPKLAFEGQLLDSSLEIAQGAKVYLVAKRLATSDDLLQVIRETKAAPVAIAGDNGWFEFEQKLDSWKAELAGEAPDWESSWLIMVDAKEENLGFYESLALESTGNWHAHATNDQTKVRVERIKANHKSVFIIRRPETMNPPNANDEVGKSKRMTISGHALDINGQPVAGANIYLTCLDPQHAMADTITDAEGRYEFKNIDMPIPPAFSSRNMPHARFEIFGTAKGYGFTWHPYIDYFPRRKSFEVANPDPNRKKIGPDDKFEFDLTFGPPAKLRGRIVDGKGKPIPGTKIGLWNVEPTPAQGYDDSGAFLTCQSSEFSSLYVDRMMPDEMRNRWTDEEGYFEFDALPSNCDFRIQASPPKAFARRMFYAATADTKLFRFEDEKVHGTGFEIEFLRNDKIPIQIVYDDTGLPAKDVYVSAYNNSGNCGRVTDPFGMVTLEVPAGDYHMQVLPEHKTPYFYGKSREELTSLSPKLEQPVIRIKRAAEVEIEVIDEATGRGVEGFDICRVEAGSQSEYHWRSWKLPRTSMVERPKTGKDGKMQVYLRPGAHEIGIGFYEHPEGYQIKTQSLKIDCKPGKVQKLKFIVKGNKI